MALSWKLKFLLLIAATFLGLAGVMFASLSGLNNVSEAYEARGQARAYQAASGNLLNDWLGVELVSGRLSSSQVESYRAALDSLTEQASELASSASQLGSPAITAGAKSIQETLAKYTSQRREWLDVSQVIGFSSQEGLRSEMSNIMDNELRQIGLSIFNNDIDVIASNYRNYLDTIDEGYAQKTREAVARMQSVVTNMEWETNEIGIGVQRFEDAFAQAEGLAQTQATLMEKLETTGASLQRLITEQNNALRDELIVATTGQARDARSSSIMLIVITSLVVLAVLVLTLTGASRTLVKRLNDTVALLSRVASGDLSERLKPGTNAKDEFNVLGHAANKMLDDISSVIGQVVEGNRTLASLQDELDALIKRMGRNSELVEQETEQTATAVQEISHTAVDIARYTQSVNEATQNANEAAQAGDRVVKRSAETMSTLSERIQKTHDQIGLLSKTGEKVNSIVDVINTLAQQTNLLALNAAIEAARAGEAGRGFSVVADEVRSLAGKTVSATNGIADIVESLNRETSAITTMMQEGLRSAEEGEKNSEAASGAIDQITGSIHQLAGDMGQVVSSIEGISTTTEEIAQKVEQIHGHTRETADIRKQLNAHIARLSSQTAAMSEAAQRFRL